MSVFAQFVYLQLLDALTTVAFLLNGVGEANPIVRWALQQSWNPLGGLILVKVAAVALGIYCLMGSRTKLLRKANAFFALLVAYNLVVVIMSSPALSQ